jgi:hypothetical protein
MKSYPSPAFSISQATNTLTATAGTLVPGSGTSSWTDLTSANGMPTNPLSLPLDIQWETIAAFYDPAHSELHYIGKAASSQGGADPNNHWFTHYVFDIVALSWKRILQYNLLHPSITTGHAWQVGFDRDTGDIYIQRYNTETISYFTRSVWAAAGKPSATVAVLPTWWNGLTGPGSDFLTSSDTVSNALTVHPNCFGPGQKGLVICGGRHVWGWHKNTNAWYTLTAQMTDPSIYSFGGGNGGGGVYCPGGGFAITGSGTANNGTPTPVHRTPAGTAVGNRTDTISGQKLPILCKADNAAGSGWLTQHPNNPEHLIVCRRDGGAVYKSTDYGASWSLMPGVTHPFGSQQTPTFAPATGGQHLYTVACMTGMGVLIALKSTAGFAARMWKPPAT